MKPPQLHKTQISILHSLRYAPSERFSALMRPTGHTSDTFKFHIQTLGRLGYIAKSETGDYQLTASGKEYANSINEQSRAVEKQPKISVLLVVSKPQTDKPDLFLVQKRLRNPFFGYWSEIHGRATWGEPFEATAQRQLLRQTGLTATFQVTSFLRATDFDTSSQELLKDKLFVIVTASSVSGELRNEYDGGNNAWLTLDELRGQKKVFVSTLAIIESLNMCEFYQVQQNFYSPEDY